MSLLPIKPQKRDVDGFLLLDKPPDISSNKALQDCKRLFQAKKAGHGGTLDPIADGALPILFGNYTCLARHFLSSSKVYEGRFILGASTTTGDREGNIVTRAKVPSLSIEDIEECLQKFRGNITQKPPLYSAIKYKGKPLYKYVRQGRTVPVPLRQVHIFSLRFLDYEDEILRIRVRCSKGTYIRSLAVDIGKELGCGAFVQSLRRTHIGKLTSDMMVTFTQLRQEEKDIRDYLTKDISALTDIEQIRISPRQAQRFCHGNIIPYIGSNTEGEVCVLLDLDTNKKQLLGLATIVGRNLQPRRIFTRQGAGY